MRLHEEAAQRATNDVPAKKYQISALTMDADCG
jgi:hypothetical protein